MPRRARLRLVTVVGSVALAVTTVGCSSKSDIASDLPRPSRAYCNAAANYDEAITMGTVPVAEHLRLTRAMAAHAPTDIRADLATVIAAYERLQSGDDGVVDDPKVKAALDHVNRRTTQDCGWFQRQGL